MSKKDYILIANVIKGESSTWAKQSVGGRAVASVAFFFAEKLAKENPRFDRDRFLTACGIEDDDEQENKTKCFACGDEMDEIGRCRCCNKDAF